MVSGHGDARLNQNSNYFVARFNLISLKSVLKRVCGTGNASLKHDFKGGKNRTHVVMVHDW